VRILPLGIYLIARVFALLALGTAAASAQVTQPWGWDDGTVPYVQTPPEIVERMLRMAEVRKGDFLIDLGSGDGRIVIEAAKRGARGMGVDYDGNLVQLASENAERAGVADRARFEKMDLFDADLSPASVVSMYLLPNFNEKLLPRLLRLKPGTRIVSHDGGIGDWPPDESLQMRAPEKPVGVGGISICGSCLRRPAGRGPASSPSMAAAGRSASRRSSRCSTSTPASPAARIT
jgi:SAM-dependent methyltransferase